MADHIKAVPDLEPAPPPSPTSADIERAMYRALNALPEDVKKSLFPERPPEDIVVPAGHAAMIRTNLGLGIIAEHRADNRIYIYIDPEPIKECYDGPALRSFMEEIAVSWLRQVAPHRLSEAYHSGY